MLPPESCYCPFPLLSLPKANTLPTLERSLPLHTPSPVHRFQVSGHFSVIAEVGGCEPRIAEPWGRKGWQEAEPSLESQSLLLVPLFPCG